MAILALSHDRKYSFDDVHIGEEVDLEDFVDQADCPTALSQLFHGAYDSCIDRVSQLKSYKGISGSYLRWLHIKEHRFAQTLRQPQRQLLGIDRQPYGQDPISASKCMVGSLTLTYCRARRPSDAPAIALSASHLPGTSENLRFGLLFSQTQLA